MENNKELVAAWKILGAAIVIETIFFRTALRFTFIPWIILLIWSSVSVWKKSKALSVFYGGFTLFLVYIKIMDMQGIYVLTDIINFFK